MNTQKLISKSIFISLLTTICLQGCGNPNNSSEGASSGQLANQKEIFRPATSGSSDTASIASIQDEKSSRRRLVQVNFDEIVRASEYLGSRLRLNLFDDEVVDIVLEDVQKISARNIIIVGRIVNDPDSAATLVINEDSLVANIKRGEKEESFEIKSAGNGLHVVHKPLEQEGKGVCAEVKEDGVNASEPSDLLTKAFEGQTDPANPLATPTIDILAAYTPRARSYQGGTTAIKALIQMGIADTNRALIDSGVNLRVRLVGTMELKSNESGDWSSDLYRLKSTSDGKWDDVHPARRRLGADQVSVVGWYSGSSTAGIGYVSASYSNAFSITKASMFRQYTFSHELGHNLGLNHSDGYVNSSGRFRTIIAYGSYPRIRRYSNPNIRYNGYVTGTAYRNEAKILNANSFRVASLASPAIAADQADAMDVSFDIQDSTDLQID